MYEAPDRFKRMKAARLPDGESLGLTSEQADTTNTPLKDVQLISRAQLAPFFTAANICAAVMAVAALWRDAEPFYLLPWLGAVAVANFIALQMAKTQAITHVGRSGRRVPAWLLVGDVALRAVIWLSLPLYLFTSIPPGDQVILASIASGLGIAGLAGWLPFAWRAPLRGGETVLVLGATGSVGSVAIQVATQERTVRQQVKAAGGKWNPDRVVWELPYGQVAALGLTDRIVTPRERRAQASHLPVDGRRQELPSTNR